jgi:hypothetical protein
MTHHRKNLALTVSGVALLATGVNVPSTLAATAAGAAPVATPACGWPYAVNADVLSRDSSFNISNPDTGAAYWVMPFEVENGLRIALSGHYPDSRYMSVEVYSSSGSLFSEDGVTSALADYRIAPGPGSVNPWQHKAAPGGRFTITLQSPVVPGEVNTLPLAPAGAAPGTEGLIFYRAYLPVNADPWLVPLPTVTSTLNGVTKRLPTCLVRPSSPPASAEPTPPTGPTPTAPPGFPGEVYRPFARALAGTGGTPDAYQAYLSAIIVPPLNGDVVVVRAKAPTTPEGTAPAPWPASGEQLRYWSMCVDLQPSPTPVVVNHLPGGKVDLGCRYDNQVELDAHGYYTFVLGTEAQRAAINRVPATTFLPFSTAFPADVYKLNLRNMLPGPGFSHAVQDVTANADPATAAAVMGAYYPRAGICSITSLAQHGPDACSPAVHPRRSNMDCHVKAQKCQPGSSLTPP